MGESSNCYWLLETDENGHDTLGMFWRESGKPENIRITDLTDAEEQALLQVLNMHMLFRSTQRPVITNIVYDNGQTRG